MNNCLCTKRKLFTKNALERFHSLSRLSVFWNFFFGPFSNRTLSYSLSRTSSPYFEHYSLVPSEFEITSVDCIKIKLLFLYFPAFNLYRSREGFHDWTFSTVRYWGEQPQGVWRLHIFDKGDGEHEEGTLVAWRITFYGSLQTPHEIQERKKYVVYDLPRHPSARNML